MRTTPGKTSSSGTGKNDKTPQHIFSLFLATLLALILPGCGRNSTPQAAGFRMTVSILPHAWFVQRIAGDRVHVMVLVGPGQNPHSYEPTPKQMTELSSSSAWILSGTEFEKSLKPKISSLYPSLPIEDGTAGVTFRHLEETSDPDHHVHSSDRDPHTWLGSEPSLILARRIRDLLVRIDPEHSEEYARNHAALDREIRSVYEGLRRSLSHLKGSSVLVYHPAFGYFLDEFGIRQQAVETGGKEPNPRALAELIRRAREENARVLFVQSQFSDRSARVLADSLGIRVLALDPLDPDWLGNIRRMGAILEESLRSP